MGVVEIEKKPWRENMHSEHEADMQAILFEPYVQAYGGMGDLAIQHAAPLLFDICAETRQKMKLQGIFVDLNGSGTRIMRNHP